MRVLELVQLILCDQTTSIEDGAFDDREVLCAHRHAQNLSQLFAAEGFDAADAQAIAAALRAPGVDGYRATLVLKACAHRGPSWETLAASMIGDSDARVRIIAIRAGLYAYSRAMRDDLPAVRVAVLQLLGGGQCHELYHPLVRQALGDPVPRVRMAGLALVRHLPDWRSACEQLLDDEDSKVQSMARRVLMATSRHQRFE